GSPGRRFERRSGFRDRSSQPPVVHRTTFSSEAMDSDLRVSAASSGEALFRAGGEVGELMRPLDWAAAPLGPVEAWPQSLKTTVRILLTSRFSMWMGWGPELAFLYNDAYKRDTLGKKHPSALGKPAEAVWAEIWDDIGPRVRRVLATGEAT